MTEPSKMFERAVCFTHGSPRSMFERQGACASVATESSVADTCSHATPRCQSCTPLLAASSAFLRGKNRCIRYYICLSTSPFYNYSGSTYMCYCSRPNVGARKTLRKAHSLLLLLLLLLLLVSYCLLAAAGAAAAWLLGCCCLVAGAAAAAAAW